MRPTASIVLALHALWFGACIDEEPGLGCPTDDIAAPADAATGDTADASPDAEDSSDPQRPLGQLVVRWVEDVAACPLHTEVSISMTNGWDFSREILVPCHTELVGQDGRLAPGLRVTHLPLDVPIDVTVQASGTCPCPSRARSGLFAQPGDDAAIVEVLLF